MARPTIRQTVASVPVSLPQINRGPDPFVTEFRAYLAIDKSALDDALQQQADLYFQVSQEYALALSLRDEAKETLARVDAGLSFSFRQREEKATESKVKDQVAKDVQHAMSYSDYLAKKTRADVLFSLQESFSQRGYAIRYLCNLYQATYFTTTVKQKGERDLTAGQAAAARAAMSRDRKG